MCTYPVNHILEHLKNKGLIWQGDFHPDAMHQAVANNAKSRSASSTSPSVSPFKELEHGFPQAFNKQNVTAINASPGIGELRLLIPTLLENAQQNSKKLIWISPPAQPNAQMLHCAGLDLSRIWVIHPKDEIDSLWAAEQCLASGCCHSLLLWQQSLTLAQSKRLQQAAIRGRAQLFILHSSQQSTEQLPVPLSMQLSANGSDMQIAITRCKGSWPPPPIKLNMQKYWPKLCGLKANEAMVIHFPQRRVS